MLAGMVRPVVLGSENELPHAQTGSRHAYSSVLHELIYALMGFTGDVFVDERPGVGSGSVLPPNKSLFHVSEEAGWLTDADRAEINEILTLGFHYAEIERFVSVNQHPLDIGARQGIWQGLAMGLEELCVVYQAAVLRVEQHVLAADTPTLASIRHYLSEFIALLPAIHTLLWGLTEEKNPSDVMVMDALHRRSVNGDLGLQSVLQRLLWNCNQIMYKHLSAWLLRGALLDTGYQFFITQAPKGKASGAFDMFQSHVDVDGAISWASFELHLSRVPLYIPSTVPYKLLDIGRAVRLLQQHASTSAGPAASRLSQVDTHAATHGSTAAAAAGVAADGNDAGGELATVAPAALLSDADLEEFAARLRQLAAAPQFSGAAMAHAVDMIHDKVGAALNRFMRHSAHLQAHLATIESYILLGRGDFTRELLDASADVMRRAPVASTAHSDLQRPFAAAAARCNADADPHFAHVSLAWHRELPTPDYVTNKVPVIPAAAAAEPGAPSWNSIQLTYTPPWPLPLLLNRPRLWLYEALSTYLLSVARAQRALDDTWQHLVTQKRASRRAPPPPQWALHQRMAHFVRHVHVYLKDDVIKRSFEVMREEVEVSTTFEQVEASHERLQERLKALTFLSHTAVCEKLQSVLQQCTLLCSVVTEGVDVPLKSIEDAFAANAAIFKSLLQSAGLQGQTRGIEVIKQLLLRLDFNVIEAGPDSGSHALQFEF